MNSDRINAAARQHLARVKSLPCGVCGQPGPSDAHHIKQGLHFACIPLCADCHRGSFNGWHGQRRMWKVKKLDELDVLSQTIQALTKG